MNCQNCGHPLPDGEKYCFHCGALQTRTAHPAAGEARHGAPQKTSRGPGTTLLVIILVALLAVALLIWGLVFHQAQGGGGAAPVSSESDVSSQPEPAVTGLRIGSGAGTDVLLAEDKDFYLVSLETGEATRIGGLSEKGTRIVTATVCGEYIYYVEQTASYAYLYRLAARPDAVAEPLRLNDQGKQMRTGLAQLLTVNGRLCGLARYDGDARYVEVYLLNAEGRYSVGDATTRILYTTQNVASEKDKALLSYTIAAAGNTLTVLYEGQVVQECPVS